MFSFLKRPQIPYDRVLVMGDIHGMSRRFFSLMDKIAFDLQKDLLILLGDYIDRGDGSLLVLTYVKGLVRDGNCIALRGNHEDMMLSYLTDGSGDWLENGGQQMLEQLLAIPTSQQEALLDFIRQMPLYHRMTLPTGSILPWARQQDIIFVHAGVLNNVPLEKQPADVLCWIRPTQYSYKGKELLVVGHTPTMFLDDLTFKPIRRGRIIYMDTGSYYQEGAISCLDFLLGKLYQSSC